jgi:hypothetical protein
MRYGSSPARWSGCRAFPWDKPLQVQVCRRPASIAEQLPEFVGLHRAEAGSADEEDPLLDRVQAQDAAVGALAPLASGGDSAWVRRFHGWLVGDGTGGAEWSRPLASPRELSQLSLPPLPITCR